MPLVDTEGQKKMLSRMVDDGRGDFDPSSPLKSVPEEGDLLNFNDDNCKEKSFKKNLFLTSDNSHVCARFAQMPHTGCGTFPTEFEDFLLQHDSDIAGLHSAVEQCGTRVQIAEDSLREWK